ncbi:ATP-dependent DNA helicase PcrA [bacterium]|nr:ATP-dependent DNA helicase PcrA [Candidatus Elulimicrobium humile]
MSKEKIHPILRGLNNKQLEAAQTIEGPVLVLAGAGSGKTSTLTKRIAYMIAQGISSYNILAVTFTNKAAKEMKERISHLLETSFEGAVPAMPMVGTFHSVCLNILHREAEALGYDRSFLIYDTTDSQNIIKDLLKKRDISKEQVKPATIHNLISKAKNNLVSATQFATYNPTSPLEELAIELYQEYQKQLRKNNAMDFDDIIMNTVVLFKEFSDVLAKYQERFKYIMIDEYQDTNQAQYELVKLLANKYKNLCVVGDDFQAIYSWRGADFKNILNFEKDYKNTKVVLLEQNYRSTQIILDAANQVIEKNSQRTDKNLWTDKESGDLIQLVEAENEYQESLFVARTIKDLVGSGKYPLSGFACLYRTNAQSRALEEAFLQLRIPYQIVGGTKFYERAEIKDLLAYLKFIYNNNDTASFRRIINVPKRSVGKASVDKILAAYSEMSEIDQNVNLIQLLTEPERFGLKLTGKAKSGILAFCEQILELRGYFEREKYNLSQLVADILKITSYTSHWEKNKENEARMEYIEELFTVTQKFDNLSVEEALYEFLQETALLSDIDGMQASQAVTLMTYHAAKGLEFPVVFMIGMEEGILPHSRSLVSHKELEEERRLCYVGITRAKDKLYMTYTQLRRIFGQIQSNPSSRFINEIPDHLLEQLSLTYTDYDPEW